MGVPARQVHRGDAQAQVLLDGLGDGHQRCAGEIALGIGGRGGIGTQGVVGVGPEAAPHQVGKAEQILDRAVQRPMRAEAGLQPGAEGIGEPVAGRDDEVGKGLGDGGLGPEQARGAHGADGKRGHRSAGGSGLQPAPDPAGGIAGWGTGAEETALDPGLGVEMAAGGFGQACGMDQRQVTRVIKIGQRGGGRVEAEIHIGDPLPDHAARRIALAQDAQVLGAGGDEVGVRGGRDKRQPVGAAAQEDHHEDRIAGHVGPIASGNRG